MFDFNQFNLKIKVGEISKPFIPIRVEIQVDFVAKTILLRLSLYAREGKGMIELGWGGLEWAGESLSGLGRA